jgi:hypothetical protein
LHPRFAVQLVGLPGLLAALLALGACGTSGAHGVDASASADASADAPDATDDVVQVVSDSSGGPYPSLDAPEYGPDGCLLNATPCTSDSMCCQGYCNQGECANGAHPGDRPFH